MDAAPRAALKPPTGFLRDIVVEGSGEHRGTFDIKHGGLMPIVDLARYAALKAGTRVTATVERLHAAEAEGVLDSTQSGILEEAYELFGAIRLQHQVEQLEAKKDPDDHLEPKLLNPLTRRYLRDAFREVAAVQRAAARDLARAADDGAGRSGERTRLPQRAGACSAHPGARSPSA